MVWGRLAWRSGNISGEVDRIRIGYEATGALSRAIEAHASYVREETLAVELSEGLIASPELREETDLDGEMVTITVSRT